MITGTSPTSTRGQRVIVEQPAGDTAVRSPARNPASGMNSGVRLHDGSVVDVSVTVRVSGASSPAAPAAAPESAPAAASTSVASVGRLAKLAKLFRLNGPAGRVLAKGSAMLTGLGGLASAAGAAVGWTSGGLNIPGLVYFPASPEQALAYGTMGIAAAIASAVVIKALGSDDKS